jgi:DNA-binding PadR family transcriptional regulator
MAGRIKPGALNLTAGETRVLIALARLGAEAYGVAIADELTDLTGRDTSIAAVYAALDRLDRLGLATAQLGSPRPARGGRAKRHYLLTPRGREVLQHERDLAMALWGGIPLDPRETDQ